MVYQRALSARLQAGLSDTPAVLLVGPRQAGKSTLARQAAATPAGRDIHLVAGATPHAEGYVSLDDFNMLSAAHADPQGFLESLRAQRIVVIDEVQRAPEILVAIKREIDIDRRPGRFLLTGSANVLSMPKISESLAGRVEPLTLWSLAQCEFEGHTASFLERAFSADAWDTVNSETRQDLLARAMRGGYPEAVSRQDPSRRSAWFGAYLSTVVQREIKDISAIDDAQALLRILRTVASRSGGPRNIQTLATDTGIPNTTIQRYLALLSATFLISEIPAWFRSVDARLIKSPKILLSDSGLYANLLSLSSGDAQRGFLFETFVGTELQRLISFVGAHEYTLLHFRTRKQHEVDFVVERADRRIVGCEVKLSRTVTESDFAGMRALQEAAGEYFHSGIVLYCGARSLPFGKNFWAVPVNALWE